MARSSTAKAVTTLMVVAGLLSAMASDAGSRHLKVSFGPGGLSLDPVANAPVSVICWVGAVVALGGVGAILASSRVERKGGVHPFTNAQIVLRVAVVLGCAGLVLGYLIWAAHGERLDLSNIVVGAIGGATPLILGSAAGVISERSGVINITIEGEFLAAACASAVVATVAHSAWLGLVAGIAAGAIVGGILALFAVRYSVDQIVAGLILITLITGVTGYLFGQIIDPNQTTLNSPPTFSGIAIPLLDRLPVIGTGIFDQSIIFYIAILTVVLVELILGRTVIGLRTRACGESPRAALGAGVNVRRIRSVACMVSGGIAGIGGVYFTVGSAGPFVPQMTAGLGYVALAAVIFGGWRATRAALAALLFGFGTSLGTSLGVLNVNVNPELLIVLPYLVTIAALAGVVGVVRPPAADGVPLAEA